MEPVNCARSCRLMEALPIRRPLQDFRICFNPELLHDGRASGFSRLSSQRCPRRSCIYGSDKEEGGRIHSVSGNGSCQNFFGGVLWGSREMLAAVGISIAIISHL